MSTPDVFTYRYEGFMVYVTPAKSYEEAVQFVRQVFKQLRNVDSERIAICVNGIVNKERKHVRIGPMAWNAVVPTLARFEVLDIFIEPVEDSQPSASGEKSVGGASAGGLPDYEDVVDGTETKQSFIHRAMKAFGKA